MNKQFESKLTEFNGALKQKFAGLNISEEELRRVSKSPDELVTLVSQKTGAPREEVDKKVHQLMDDLHIGEGKGFFGKFTEKVENKYEEIKNKLTH